MATKKRKTVKFTKAMELPANAVKKITYGGQEYEIEIKRVLELSEVGRIVNDAVDMAVLPGDRTYPWLVHFAIDYAVVSHCTNVVLPPKADEAERIIAQTGIVDVIVDVIGEDVWRAIVNYVHDAVNAAERARLGRSQIDATLNTIREFVELLKAKLADMSTEDILGFAKENLPELADGIEAALDEKETVAK